MLHLPEIKLSDIMISTNDIALIYARKSRATEKGESIEHQIEKNSAYCDSMGWDYLIFIDYDFSGGSTKRPDFDRMMKLIKTYKGRFKASVCYKLARVCRNMVDFVNLFEFLFQNGLDFVSVSENFNTHTAIGRAQMYFAAIFAEMERENVREQVSDNMFYRARKGKWNGGPIPIGFDKIKVELPNIKGVKYESKLIINESETGVVWFINTEYSKEDGSIRGLTKKLILEGYKTKQGNEWRENQVGRVLKNPLYCIADEDAFNYFNEPDNPIRIHPEDNVREKFDGSHGLILYGKRKYKNETTTAPRDKEEWVLAIGEHQGFIPGKLFVHNQRKLALNKEQAPRLGTSTKSPLTGLVRCKKCNTAMTLLVSKKNKNEDGYSYIYFDCRRKTETSGVLCIGTRVNARYLEERIIECLKGLFNDENKVNEILNQYNQREKETTVDKDEIQNKINRIKTELKKTEKGIINLVDAITSGAIPSHIAKDKYDELEEKKKAYEEELTNLNFALLNDEEVTIDTEYVLSILNKITPEDLDEADFDMRKYFYRNIIEEIHIDEKNIEIKLFFSTDNKLLVCNHRDRGSWRL